MSGINVSSIACILVGVCAISVEAESFFCNTTSICDTICSCYYGSNQDDPTALTVECRNLTLSNETFFPCLDSNVTYLHIYGSDIMELKAEEMSHLINLKEFKIEDSLNLGTIEEKAFFGLTELAELSITNTAIAFLLPETFADLGKLAKLTIRGTNITALSSDHFKNLNGSLLLLDLSGNRMFNNMIGGIFTDDNKENTLMSLNLSNNAFDEIKDDLLANLPLVESLDMSNNVIESTDESPFESLIGLKDLDLHNNLLYEFQDGAFAKIPWQRLNLSNNHFTSVPIDGIKGSFQAKILDLSRNLIQQLEPNIFVGLEPLTELHLSNIPDFKTVKDDAFANLGLLQSLYMFNNSALETIESLAFPPNTLMQLSHMYIQNNGLKSLPGHLFRNTSFLPALQEVEAHGNPFNCSCDAAWMRESMDDDTISWIQPWKEGSSAVRCQTPDNFNQTEIYHFDVYDLTCDLPLIEHQEQFSEVNNVEYYMQVMLRRGLPSTNWTLPSGKIMRDGDTDDPKTGRDIITVKETRLQNNTIITRLTIKYPSVLSAGKYTMTAWNVAGIKRVVFTADPPPSSPEDKLRNVGLIVGVVLGVIILLVVFVVVVRFIRTRPPSYKRMEEPSRSSRDPGTLPSSQGNAGGEQGPFMVSGQSSSYGGVGTNRQPQKDDPQA